MWYSWRRYGQRAGDEARAGGRAGRRVGGGRCSLRRRPRDLGAHAPRAVPRAWPPHGETARTPRAARPSTPARPAYAVAAYPPHLERHAALAVEVRRPLILHVQVRHAGPRTASRRFSQLSEMLTRLVRCWAGSAGEWGARIRTERALCGNQLAVGDRAAPGAAPRLRQAAPPGCQLQLVGSAHGGGGRAREG